MQKLFFILFTFLGISSGFSQGYYIKDYKVDVAINRNGSLAVEEKIKVNFTEERRGIIRVIPSLYHLKVENSVDNANPEYVNYSIAFDNVFVEHYDYSVSKLNNQLEIKIGNPDVYVTGEQEYSIKYHVWGVAQEFKKYEEVSWNIIGTQWDTYIENASFTVKLPNNKVLTSDDIKAFTGSVGSRLQNVAIVNNSPFIKGEITEMLNAREGLTLSLKFPENTFAFDGIPIQVLATEYYIDNPTSEFKILNDGSINIAQSYDVVFRENASSGFNASIRMCYEYDGYYYNYTDSIPTHPTYGLLTNAYYPTIKHIVTSENSDLYLSESVYNHYHTIDTRGTGTVNTRFSYNVYDLLVKTGPDYKYRALAFVPLEAPSRNHTFSIELPQNAEKSEWVINAYLSELYTDNNYAIKVRNTKLDADSITNNKVWFSSSQILTADQNIYFDIQFPQKYIDNVSQLAKAQLYFYNNLLLLIPIIIALLLFVIWFFIGKDEKFTTVTQFYPPQKMTPAEAGILWDYKLDKRDMISLIYHWASKGHLKIKTIDEDVELTKVKELPKTANKYELTLFKGIFGKSITISVSSLNTNAFAKAWGKAFKQLNTKVVEEGLFNKKSVAFGKKLVRVGVVIIFSTIAFALYQFGNYGDYQGPLSGALSGFAMIGFGLIMPKRAKNGTKQYANLIGFIEFIKTAEIDKVKKLYNEDSTYFDQTVSYAIVTGMGEIWAKKFAGIITTAPDWYNNNSTSMDTLSLLEDMRRRMRYFDTHARTNTRSYSSGSSSYSHSSFGSSYGGSSFSSGSSGFSGGGFGGGGGSSW